MSHYVGNAAHSCQTLWGHEREGIYEGIRTLVERSLSANQSTLVFSEPATNRPQSTLEMPVPVPQNFQYDYVPGTKEDLDWADRESALFSVSSCKRTD